jgi:hypothetical protein
MSEQLTDDALSAKGLAVLEDHLGPVQTLRFLALMTRLLQCPKPGENLRIETSDHSAFHKERAYLPLRLDLRCPGQVHRWLWEAFMLFLNSRRLRGTVASPRLASAPGTAQWR